jgi:mannose-6-phosphate isomerase
VETIAQAAALDPLSSRSRTPGVLPQRVEKPWGHELLWALGARYAAKILHIEAGCRLSLQYHRVKEETLLLLGGRMILELEGADGTLVRHEATAGQVFHIPSGRLHRLTAVETCDVIEVSTPELEDVVRLQDDFGRG